MVQTSSKKTLLQAVILLSIFKLNSGFSTTGHFIVARIAEREIMNEPFYQPMMHLLGMLQPFTRETNHPFVEAASWPDEVKYLGWKAMNAWHYDNKYIDGSKLLSKTEIKAKNLKENPIDIVSSINDCKTTLRNVKWSYTDSRLGKSIMLRMLIHLIGDIHQPLHACTLVNDDFPKGDVGGNAFVIDMPGARNLHTYWDRCLKKYSTLSSPLNERHFEKLEGYVDQIVQNYPRSDPAISKRVKVQSVAEWARESVKYCISNVYQGIHLYGAPSALYKEKNFAFIDEQLAVAGYRLTETLKNVFSNPATLEPRVKKNPLYKRQLTDSGVAWVSQSKHGLEENNNVHIEVRLVLFLGFLLLWVN